MKTKILKLSSVMSLLLVIGLAGCTRLAPTVEIYPSVRPSPTQELGSLLPRIQLVYPGTLQTLDYPQSYPTDVNPEGASIAVVFSHVMENDLNEMALNMVLFKDNVNLGIDISPSGASSKSFTVNPIGEEFQPDTVYTLRIYKFANVDNEPDRILDFECLVEPPATTLNPVNPDYVDYTFRTGSAGFIDDEPPVVLATNPSDGSNNVSINIPYIEVIFQDNVIPMIKPDTVDINTIKIYNVTDDPGFSNPLKTEIELIETMNFDTYHLNLIDTLANFKQYCVKISVDNKITDFRNNFISETDIFFSTE